MYICYIYMYSICIPEILVPLHLPLSNIRLVPWAGRCQEPIIRLPEEKRKVTMTALGLLFGARQRSGPFNGV